METIFLELTSEFDAVIQKEFNDPKFTKNGRNRFNDRRGRRRKMFGHESGKKRLERINEESMLND